MNGIVLKDGLTPSFNKMSEGIASAFGIIQKMNKQMMDFAKTSIFDKTLKDISSASGILKTINSQFKGIKNISIFNNTKNKSSLVQQPMNNDEETPVNTQSIIEGFDNKSVIGFAKKSAKIFMDTFSQAIQTASELAEVQHMLDSVYQSSAAEVTAWAKEALDAYGINTTSAMKYVATMGAMMNSMQISSSSAAKMSEDLVGLAGDLASFYNIGADEVFSKISAAISGDGSSLKEYNINMNAAQLEAYALSQGLDKTYQSMTAAEQATLKYNYLMAETANIQGDYGRTSGSFANQQQRMNDKWVELTSTLAAYFLPVAATVFGIVGGAFDFLTEHSEQVIAALIAISIALAVMLTPKFLEMGKAAIKSAIKIASSWGIALWPLLLIVAAVVAAITIFNEFGITISDIMGVVGGLLGGLYAFFMNIVITVYNILGSLANFIGNFLVNPFAAVGMLILDLATTILGWIDTIFAALENLVNLLPWVEVDFTSGLNNLINEVEKARSELSNKTGVDKFEMKETMDISQTMGDWNSSWSNFKMPDSPFSDNFTLDGGNIDTVGSIGEIKGDVKITDEDIKLLKDIATNKFVNRYTTLSPNMRVEFSGPISRDVDVDDVISKIETKLEEVSSSSVIEEVVYA